LRAADVDPMTVQDLSVVDRDSMDGMSLWHVDDRTHRLRRVPFVPPSEPPSSTMVDGAD
jgi:hypothetical protein